MTNTTNIMPELLAQYFQERGKRHIAYQVTSDKYNDLLVHANGLYPHKLIEERRPNEPITVKEYRVKLYKPKSKETFSRVLVCLGRIQRAEDFKVDYHEADKSLTASIKDGELPRQYFEKNFPNYKNVTNWVFGIGLKNYAIDANGVVLMMPLAPVAQSTDYVQPFPFIFNSPQVYEYEENNFAVLLSTEKVQYPSQAGYASPKQGNIFWVVTTTAIKQYKETLEGKYTEGIVYEHNLGYLPCRKFKGLHFSQMDATTVYESRLAGMQCGLDEAAREYNDLQAGVVLHLYQERWEYASQKCPNCMENGISTGRVKSADGKKVTKCPMCRGTSYVGVGPFSTMVIQPEKASGTGNLPAPIPPAGYINKPLDIVELQDKRVHQHLLDALSAVNMQNLDNSPLAQSGIAKAFDRDEQITLATSIAEDLIDLMDFIYATGIDYRYQLVIPNAADRKQLAPIIRVPQQINLVSPAALMDEIQQAVTAQASPVIIQELQENYVKIKFPDDDELYNVMRLSNILNPLPNLSQEEIVAALNGGLCTKEAAVMAVNISSFISRALEEFADGERSFVAMDETEQKKVLCGYAKEVVG